MTEPLPQLWISFSAYSNVKKLVTVSKKPYHLVYLNGIRAISLLWVHLAHSYLTSMYGPTNNEMEIIKVSWLSLPLSSKIFLIFLWVAEYAFFDVLEKCFDGLGYLFSDRRLTDRLHISEETRLWFEIQRVPLLHPQICKVSLSTGVRVKTITVLWTVLIRSWVVKIYRKLFSAWIREKSRHSDRY